MPGFVKGQSGNPKGRPKSYKGCQKLRDLIGSKAETIVNRLLKAVIDEGDTLAAKLLLERAVPALKSVELPAKIPIPQDAGLADQGRAIVAALSAGQLAPSQASQILTALAGIARLVELDEISQRLTALEAKHNGND